MVRLCKPTRGRWAIPMGSLLAATMKEKVFVTSCNLILLSEMFFLLANRANQDLLVIKC